MEVKRYMGKTNQEALEKVKKNLGNDAIILSTKKIRQKGLKGLFSKPLVEVVAAIEEPNALKNRNVVKPNMNLHKHELNEFSRQIDTMNMAMDQLLVKLEQTKPAHIAQTEKDPVPVKFSKYFDNMIQREVHRDIAMELIKEAQNVDSQDNMDPLTSLTIALSAYIGESSPMPKVIDSQKKVLFMGPTGVGKTTTLAKLAAIYSVEYGYEVGLITADTYRIGAADQLKTYSDILGIPLEIIYGANEIREPLNRLKDKDIIFIDTAGKSIKDKEHPEEIDTLLRLSNADEVFLCISASTSYQACINIINSYKFLDEYKIIYTKADEITSYGNILNCCYMSKQPISYITTGQNVPDDIAILDPSEIKADLLGI